MTLVELLVTVAIGFTLMGLVAGVLIQSFKNMEISDTHINLRQEGNIIISMLSSAHLASGEETYDIGFKRINNQKWELTIGDQLISNTDYDIKLEIRAGSDTTSVILDTTDLSVMTRKLTISKKVALNVKKLTLTNKKDPTKKFELSTIISRL
jgi:hypothetical protein